MYCQNRRKLQSGSRHQGQIPGMDTGRAVDVTEVDRERRVDVERREGEEGSMLVKVKLAVVKLGCGGRDMENGNRTLTLTVALLNTRVKLLLLCVVEGSPGNMIRGSLGRVRAVGAAGRLCPRCR